LPGFLGGALYAQGWLTILWFFFFWIAVNSFQKHSVIQDVILNIAKRFRYAASESFDFGTQRIGGDEKWIGSNLQGFYHRSP